jgi:hypothetical protein
MPSKVKVPGNVLEKKDRAQGLIKAQSKIPNTEYLYFLWQIRKTSSLQLWQ